MLFKIFTFKLIFNNILYNIYTFLLLCLILFLQIKFFFIFEQMLLFVYFTNDDKEVSLNV